MKNKKKCECGNIDSGKFCSNCGRSLEEGEDVQQWHEILSKLKTFILSPYNFSIEYAFSLYSYIKSPDLVRLKGSNTRLISPTRFYMYSLTLFFFALKIIYVNVYCSPLRTK